MENFSGGEKYLSEEWNKKLEEAGMPEELPSEQEKAAEAGIDLESLDGETDEAKLIAAQLKREDSSNKFGGFPESIETVVSLIDTLTNEWIAKGLNKKDIRIAIHPSCVNEADCVTVSQNGGFKYHYNTEHMADYSREALLSALRARRLMVVEY